MNFIQNLENLEFEIEWENLQNIGMTIEDLEDYLGFNIKGTGVIRADMKFKLTLMELYKYTIISEFKDLLIDEINDWISDR